MSRVFLDCSIRARGCGFVNRSVQGFTIGKASLADQLGVADFGSPGFEILGDLVVISGYTTEQGF